MTDPTAVVPPTYSMSAVEIQTLALDATNYLATGQSISNVSVTMTRSSDGKVATLTDAATVSGNVVTQILRGSDLDAGSVYLLRVQFTASPSIDKWAMDLEVSVTP